MRLKREPLPHQVLNGLRAKKESARNVDEHVWASPAPDPAWSSNQGTKFQVPQSRIPSSLQQKSGALGFLASPALKLIPSRHGPRMPNKWWRKPRQVPYQTWENGLAAGDVNDPEDLNLAPAKSPEPFFGKEPSFRKELSVQPSGPTRATHARGSFQVSMNVPKVQGESKYLTPATQICNLAKSCLTKQAKVVRLRRRTSTLEAEFTSTERLSFQCYNETMQRFDQHGTIDMGMMSHEDPKRSARLPVRGTVAPPMGFSFHKEEEEEEEEWSPMVAQKYQKQFNVPMDWIMSARSIFERYDLTGDGKLDPEEFELLLRSMLKDNYKSAKQMPRELFKRADASDDGQVDFAEFLQWFTSHAFLEKMLMPPSQQKVRGLARKWEIPLDIVETIHKEFSRYDEDESGTIEFEEFKKLLYTLLKIPSGLDLPNSRVTAFWKEIDIDGSGYVDFEEFLSWYRRYFDVKGGGSMASPIEQFYSSIRGGRPEW